MTAAKELTDADIQELDELLALVPAPYETLDAVLLDGYLCGVLVQPVMLTPEAWLPPIFGSQDALEPGDTWPADKHQRLLALIQRRFDELLRGMLEDGWFDPLIPLPEDDDGQPLTGDAAFEGLGYWVAGFEWALANFTQLEEASLSGVPDLLDSIWRHLPDQDEAQQLMTTALNEEHPLKTLDSAIEALVFDVVDLAEIGTAERIKVTTVVREQPKVGRNDVCPCGSGKKYKACHGAN
jgi:uncharacterized protein